MRKTKSNNGLGTKEANRAGTPLPSTLPIKRLSVFSRLSFILKVPVLNHRQQNDDIVNSLSPLGLLVCLAHVRVLTGRVSLRSQLMTEDFRISNA